MLSACRHSDAPEREVVASFFGNTISVVRNNCVGELCRLRCGGCGITVGHSRGITRCSQRGIFTTFGKCFEGCFLTVPGNVNAATAGTLLEHAPVWTSVSVWKRLRHGVQRVTEAVVFRCHLPGAAPSRRKHARASVLAPAGHSRFHSCAEAYQPAQRSLLVCVLLSL